MSCLSITMYDPTTRRAGCSGTFSHCLNLMINRIKRLWQACMYNADRVIANVIRLNKENFRHLSSKQLGKLCQIDFENNEKAKQHIYSVMSSCFEETNGQRKLRAADQELFERICDAVKIGNLFQLLSFDTDNILKDRVVANLTKVNKENLRNLSDTQLRMINWIDFEKNEKVKHNIYHVMRSCFEESNGQRKVRAADQETFARICNALGIHVLFELQKIDTDRILEARFKELLKFYSSESLKASHDVLGMLPLEDSKREISTWSLKELFGLIKDRTEYPHCAQIRDYAIEFFQHSFKDQENVKNAVGILTSVEARCLSLVQADDKKKNEHPSIMVTLADNIFTKFSADNANLFIAQLNKDQKLEFFSKQLENPNDTLFRDCLVVALERDVVSKTLSASTVFDCIQKIRGYSDLNAYFYNAHLTYPQFNRLARHFSDHQLLELTTGYFDTALYINHWVFAYIHSNRPKFLEDQLSAFKKLSELVTWLSEDRKRIFFGNLLPQSTSIQKAVEAGEQLLIDKIVMRAKELLAKELQHQSWQIGNLPIPYRHKLYSIMSEKEWEDIYIFDRMDLTDLIKVGSSEALRKKILSTIFPSYYLDKISEILRMPSPNADYLRVAKIMFDAIQERQKGNLPLEGDLLVRWEQIKKDVRSRFPQLAATSS